MAPELCSERDAAVSPAARAGCGAAAVRAHAHAVPLSSSRRLRLAPCRGCAASSEVPARLKSCRQAERSARMQRAAWTGICRAGAGAAGREGVSVAPDASQRSVGARRSAPQARRLERLEQRQDWAAGAALGAAAAQEEEGKRHAAWQRQRRHGRAQSEPLPLRWTRAGAAGAPERSLERCRTLPLLPACRLLLALCCCCCCRSASLLRAPRSHPSTPLRAAFRSITPIPLSIPGVAARSPLRLWRAPLRVPFPPPAAAALRLSFSAPRRSFDCALRAAACSSSLPHLLSDRLCLLSSISPFF